MGHVSAQMDSIRLNHIQYNEVLFFATVSMVGGVSLFCSLCGLMVCRPLGEPKVQNIYKGITLLWQSLVEDLLMYPGPCCIVDAHSWACNLCIGLHFPFIKVIVAFTVLFMIRKLLNGGYNALSLVGVGHFNIITVCSNQEFTQNQWYLTQSWWFPMVRAIWCN